MCAIIRATREWVAAGKVLLMFCVCRPAADAAGDIHRLWLAMPRAQGQARHGLAHSTCQHAQQSCHGRGDVKPLWTAGVCECGYSSSGDLLPTIYRRVKLKNAQ